MFNSDARTQMCPNDRNWPQLDLNQCKWAQIALDISKWPQMTWMHPITGETFVKSLPVMHVSVRHKLGRPPYLVCTDPYVGSMHHPLSSIPVTTKAKFLTMISKKFRPS